MTLPEATALFLAASFAPEPHAPHFGTELPGVTYLRRDHTYVSLVGYLGHFTEAVWEVYVAPKNTRTPKGLDTKAKDAKHSDFQLRGFAPVEARLLRTRGDIDSVLDTPSHSTQTG